MSTDRPTWDEYWARVGSEDYLAAKRLLELSSIQYDAAQWLEWHRDMQYDDNGNETGWSDPHATLDWDAWITDYDERGRGWSSTEHGLFQIVAALVSSEERAFPFRRTLGYLGSWETEVWEVLVNWGTGGNNREHPGRATVTAAR